MDDPQYMSRAAALARRGLYTTLPNPRVGCVIVNEQRVVGEGWHQQAGGPHAEISALKQAGSQAKGATLYVTMEPCAHHGRTPPCCEAIVAAGIGKVVCATLDPSAKNNGRGVKHLTEHGIEVTSDVAAEQVADLNPGFFSLALKGRPWVRIKLAISLDGRTALHSGESNWISGETSRRDVQFWRARSAALLTGSDTVISDDPRMNVRLSPTELGIDSDIRQPLRIVVDGRLRTSPTAMFYQNEGSALVATCSNDKRRIAEFETRGVEVWQFQAQNEYVPLRLLFKKLAEREIGEIQVESGEKLVGALIAEELYDELLLYIAPILLGDGKSLAKLPGIDTMSACQTLIWQDIARVGDDLRVIVRPKMSMEI